MHIASHIGAAFMAPFFLFSGWLGHHGDFHVPPGHSTTTATTTATTSSWHWGNDHWKDKDKDKDHHATSTASTTLSLTGITPAEGAVGATVTLTGTGFTKDSLVHFGIGAVHPATVATNGTSLTFKVPAVIGPYCKPTQPCPMYLSRIVGPETYKVYVFNEHATTTTVDFHVTASASTTVAAKLHLSL